MFQLEIMRILIKQIQTGIMKKFMIIYHMPPEALIRDVEPTPEEKEAGMKEWFAWKDSMGDSLVDFGSPLSYGSRLDPDGTSKESTTNVAGYSIIQANDIEEAKELLKSHPHLNWNATCDLEVHEFMEM